MVAGVVGDVEALTLRRVVWRLQGRQYFAEVTAGRFGAAVFNARRVRGSDRVWDWVDFHSAHNGRPVRRSGRAIVSGMAAAAGIDLSGVDFAGEAGGD